MAKNSAFGAALTWDGVAVAGLTAINGIEITVGTTDVTSHDSADSFNEFLPTTLDAGNVTLEGFFDYTDTTGQHAMLTDMYARSTKTGVITFPAATGTTWTFSGFIVALKIGDAAIDGSIPFTASIKITGKPTFAVTTVVGMSEVSFSNSVLVMPTFDIGTYKYAVTITNGETSTIITPTDATSGEVITITANGVSQVVTTAQPSSPIALSSSALNEITITISKTGCAPKVYTFQCAVLAA